MAGRIESLTDEQRSRFPEYIDRWIRIGLSTEPADWAAAEEGIRDAYRIAHLTPPRIVHCSSPMAMALTRAVLLHGSASVGDSVGGSVRASVRASVWASVWASVGASVRASVGASVRASVRDSVRDSVEDSVGASVRASVRDSVRASVRDSVWASVWDSVGDSVRASVGDSVRASVRASVWDSVRASVWDSVRDSVEDSGYGQHDASWIAFYAYIGEVLGLTRQTDPLRGLIQIAQSAGWFLPHRCICWVSDRHSVVRQDVTHRLHCENGAAVRYPDGWSLYYWHGVRVPEAIIEHPETITPRLIAEERNAEVRRIMLLKYGLTRYLDDVGAREVHRDRDTESDRVLYEIRDPLGAIKMIRLENSTPEVDGSRRVYTMRVPPHVGTCQEAVSWMFSMTPSAYGPRVET